MNLKLIVAMVDEVKTNIVIEAARDAGATGETVITSVRGEGLEPTKTFLGLDLAGQRDVILFLVAANRARDILEAIGDAGHFDSEGGAGVAIQIDIQDAIGLTTQLPKLIAEAEEDL